jgi:hypothetical protein
MSIVSSKPDNESLVGDTIESSFFFLRRNNEYFKSMAKS